MDFSKYFQVWDKLTPAQQKLLLNNVSFHEVKKGTVAHGNGVECTGLLLVGYGQFRAYNLSEEGREITLYRLFERDVCLFSASCIMNSIQFDVIIEAEKDSGFWIISPKAYKALMQETPVVANYTNEVMASKFSEVMWVIDQVLWKSFDKRLAGFLIDEANIEGENVITMTHEQIGNHLGNPREVVTRMLQHFQADGIVKLSRGKIEILDMDKLEEISE